MTTFRQTLTGALLSVLTLLPVVATASASDAARWSVDTAKSKVGFSGTQTGAKFEGQFSRYNADISFDPDHLDTSKISVTIDLATAATGDTQRDTALPAKEWLDVAEFPQATFVSSDIRKVGDNSYEADGNLTLRGVTRPLTLPFTLQINGATAHATGHAGLTRDAFGVGQGPWATGQWVALEVGVDIDLTASLAN